MEVLHPGLYVQEKSSTPSIEGNSTSVAGFVGTAPKGKIGEAVFLTSWSQYVSEFGAMIITHT